MYYQGYQSNNKQPAGPLILHISESYFLKFFHTVRRGSPLPHPPLLEGAHANCELVIFLRDIKKYDFIQRYNVLVISIQCKMNQTICNNNYGSNPCIISCNKILTSTCIKTLKYIFIINLISSFDMIHKYIT